MWARENDQELSSLLIAESQNQLMLQTGVHLFANFLLLVFASVNLFF